MENLNMKTLILVMIILMSAACSKKGEGLNYTQASPGAPNKDAIHVGFLDQGVQMSGLIYAGHTFDMSTLVANVSVLTNQEIVGLGYTDIGACLSSRGVTGMFYGIEGNTFTFYFVRNDVQISYEDLIGCAIFINIGLNQGVDR